MPAHLVFFLGALSFLSGIIYTSMGMPLVYVLIPAAVVCAALYSSNVRGHIAILTAVLMLIGGIYYLQDEYRYEQARATLPASGQFSGLINDDPRQSAGGQTFTFKTRHGSLAVTTDTATSYHYGDALTIAGAVKEPNPYQHSRHLVGQLLKPHITPSASGQGSLLFTALYALKHKAKAAFAQLLPAQESAFLYAIIFGESGDLPQTLAQNLDLSGLRFLTAIDGLHMQIILVLAFQCVTLILPKRAATLVALAVCGLFVALTGFTASGVRAATMASVLGIANQSGRIYLAHNALVFAAVVLALSNPQILLFDSGFQLSFLAVTAILYVLPMLRSVLHLGENAGFLGWRETLLISLSVQIATAPLVIGQFQSFSFTSLFGSIAIVWMLPFMIAGGLLLAVTSTIFFPLALALHGLVAAMVEYALIVVNLCAHLALPWNPPITYFSVACYCTVLITLVYWYYFAQKEEVIVPEVVPAIPIKTPSNEEADGYTIIEMR